ncbi:MAG TPA: nucleotidyltransferase family protein [Gillisia sp.]|nr:nucleotidyltransferase family protein [Gillisia sp.]
MREKAKIGVVILAAGSSSRLGFPKQLVKYKGVFLLQHSIDVAQSIGFSTKILVLGAKAEEIEKKIDYLDFEVVINNNWEGGMGSSISKGIVEALKNEKDLEHILMLLSDQPLVTKEQIEELIRVHLKNNKQATFSEYEGDFGVPAIFSNTIFSDLIKLKGDQGAKKIFHEKNLEFNTVNFQNGNFDIDTIVDVERLKQLEEE